MYTRKQCTMSGVSSGHPQKMTCVGSIAKSAALRIMMPQSKWFKIGEDQSRCTHVVYLMHFAKN